MLKIFQHAYIFNSIITPISYKVSKMANYASKPKHLPTTSIWQYGTGQTSSQLKISTWNVNGLRSVLKKEALQNYLLQSNPDIICINQTKIDFQAFVRQKKFIQNSMMNTCSKNINKIPQENLLGDWFQYWNFCKVSAGYSGVLTLSKYKPIKSIQDFNLDHHMSLQGRCLTLQFQKFYLINVYKPNSGANLQRLELRTQIYDKNFTQFINQLKKNKPVIVCGDMNVAHNQIDIAKPKTNIKNAGFTKQQRFAFSNFLKKSELIDSYRYLNPDKVQYTWWSTRSNSRQSNIGWRIDYMLFNKKQMIQQASIKSNIMGSDHCPIQCKVKIQ